MVISFDELPGSARLWIYQASTLLSTEQQEQISNELNTFLSGWAAHGQALTAAFEILHDRFLIIAVDEVGQKATGCSIDASVHVLQNIGESMGVDFFDRTQIAFLDENEVFLAPISEVKQKIGSGRIHKETLTFNNLVANKDDFDEKWSVKAEDSWLSRYF